MWQRHSGDWWCKCQVAAISTFCFLVRCLQTTYTSCFVISYCSAEMPWSGSLQSLSSADEGLSIPPATTCTKITTSHALPHNTLTAIIS